MKRDVDLVADAWHRLADGVDDRVRTAVLHDLLTRWAEPHRRYHDLRHLADVLRALADLPGGDRPATVLAALFHDAVYAPAAHPGANEEASARLLETLGAGCGLDPVLVGEAAALVRMTTAHRPAADDDAGRALADADLAILASPRERYLDYAAAVRAEYAHLDDATFDAGRLKVLRDLHSRRPLFATAAGQQRYETAAKANLAREIAMLTDREV